MKFFAEVTPLKKIRLEMSLNEIVECCSYYYLEVGDVKQNEVIRATNCVYRDIEGYPIEIVIDEDSGELMCRITLYIGGRDAHGEDWRSIQADKKANQD